MEGFLLFVRTTLTHVTFTVRVLSVATLESAFVDYESRTHRKRETYRSLFCFCAVGFSLLFRMRSKSFPFSPLSLLSFLRVAMKVLFSE
jgi:hypothetical protein